MLAGTAGQGLQGLRAGLRRKNAGTKKSKDTKLQLGCGHRGAFNALHTGNFIDCFLIGGKANYTHTAARASAYVLRLSILCFLLVVLRIVFMLQAEAFPESWFC